MEHEQPYTSLAAALGALSGTAVHVAHTERIFGGDINISYKLELTNGQTFFMKTNAMENCAFFAAESAGLSALRSCGVIGVVRPRAYGIDADGYGIDAGRRAGYSFLLLDYIASGRKCNDYWVRFGHELAALHRAPCTQFVRGGLFGFVQDNYIGATRQINTPADSWIAFFRDCRLRPQLERAAPYFDASFRKKCAVLLEKLDAVLSEPQMPSLVHGDLWSGNVIAGDNGYACLIDPAIYVGHAEADIAMTELFGGFPRAFYDAYNDVNLLEAGYAQRRDVYNLYHLLNHVNLFGRSYVAAVYDVVNAYV
ncbi:MAG: fructosamine kinase family protein [Treponema sp.]|nr:fructosamine kinase family protein [Treponema sp.]